MNWGHKILIAFGCFFIIMGTLIYVGANEDHQLVTENYYEQELNYQEVINQKSNAQKVGVHWQKDGDNICLVIPDSIDIIEGEIKLYRASDSNLDKSINFDPNSNCLKASDFQSGKWEISFKGNSNSEDYFSESLWIIG